MTRIKTIYFYYIISMILFGIGNYLCVNNLNLSADYPFLPWYYKEALLTMAFLGSGGLYWKYERYIDKILSLPVLIALTSGYVLLINYKTELFHVLISQGDMNWPGLIISIYSVIVFIGFCKKIDKAPILSHIGQNTIVLYFFSGAIPAALNIILSEFFGILINDYLKLFAVLVSSFFIAFLLEEIINRKLSFLLDLRVMKKCFVQRSIK